MKIALGADHAGYRLKDSIKGFLDSRDLSYTDFGTFKMEQGDYPEFAYKVADALLKKTHDCGILICGTGNGMCMTANKVKGVRAALAYDMSTAQMSRLHNDANILCMGAREINEDRALDILDVWLSTSFEGGRHQRRIDLISKLTGL